MDALREFKNLRLRIKRDTDSSLIEYQSNIQNNIKNNVNSF